MFSNYRFCLVIRFPRGCAWLIILLVLTGCSQQSPRQALEGSVKLNGKALAHGYITFFGDAKTKGPSAGGPIEDGQFSIAADRGTFAGNFRVEITSSGPSGRKVKDPDSGQMVDDMVEMIPARYNSKTILTKEVRPNEVNKFEFDLESK